MVNSVKVTYKTIVPNWVERFREYRTNPAMHLVLRYLLVLSITSFVFLVHSVLYSFFPNPGVLKDYVSTY